MTTFDKREQAHEKKYVMDEELAFRAASRRNKLLGLWAAGLLGKTGDAAAEYAKEVIVADLEQVGDDDVFRKVLSDFQAANVDVSEKKLRHEMDQLMTVARQQLIDEAAKS